MGIYNFSLSNDSPNFRNESQPALGMMCESIDIELNNVENKLIKNEIKLKDTPDQTLFDHLSHHKLMYEKLCNIGDRFTACTNNDICDMAMFIDTIDDMVSFCNREFTDLINLFKYYSTIANRFEVPEFLMSPVMSLMKLALMRKAIIKEDQVLNSIDFKSYQTDNITSEFIFRELSKALKMISSPEDILDGTDFEIKHKVEDMMKGYFNKELVITGYYYETNSRVMIFNDIEDMYRDMKEFNATHSVASQNNDNRTNNIVENAFNVVRSIMNEVYHLVCDMEHDLTTDNRDKYVALLQIKFRTLKTYYSMIAVSEIHYFMAVLNRISEKVAIQEKHKEILRTLFNNVEDGMRNRPTSYSSVQT